MEKFRTLELAKAFFKNCQKIKLRGAMKDQFERASLSVVLNIVEGAAKPTKKDRAKFYAIAYGSLKETMTLLELSGQYIYINEGNILAAHIWKLMKNPGGN